MQKINRYLDLSWHEAKAGHLIQKYKKIRFGFGKLRSAIDKYWLPGERNSDRLLRECCERALNDARTGCQDYDEKSKF